MVPVTVMKFKFRSYRHFLNIFCGGLLQLALLQKWGGNRFANNEVFFISECCNLIENDGSDKHILMKLFHQVFLQINF
jgi:hypothetical protein